MSAQTYARVVNGVVVEVITTAADITTLYHADAGFISTGAAVGVAPGWTYNGTTFAAPVLTAAQALANLATYRYGKEVAGVYFQPAAASSPLLFASDRGAQAQVANAFALATSGKWPSPSAQWKLGAGQYVVMTAADIEGLATKMGSYVQACFANEYTLAAAIATNAATDITQGWPANT